MDRKDRNMSLSSLQLQVPGVLVLEIAGATPDGSPLVCVNPGEDPQPAQVVWMKDVPDWEACAGLRAVVAVQDGEDRPVLLGLLDPPPSHSEEGAPKSLRIDSEEELVIQCGKAKIAMRADGRIEIRGGHLISRSSGPNKIKGGSVHIN
jgi:hypothetical protein